ncbi:acyl-CoA dehydrogenase C-terminal domain-containing protein [Nocardia sp. bgisy118]|uniref:acyl-CoA dehydrogenase C-terminal domain-containing protein n=1 Tax=Nocardia sp. bgisy118 TaxID=3413786 RepID=UPI003F49CA51
MRFLLAVGDLLVAWRLIVAAEIALAALDSDVSAADAAFYRGKITVASFFTTTVLPHLTAERAVIPGTDLAVMELDESGF